ncbi:MAG: hypothetical protein JOZ55_00785 [Alphaproteobacteria bacterium]|nr:hypothetical protein [Alphaproteobacteria bacterium]
MSRASLAFVAAAVLGSATPIYAQTDVNTGISDGSGVRQDIGPAESGPGVELSAVADPVRTLVHLTVYARGVDIGHIARLGFDGGRVARVLIAFNSDRAPVWIDAERVRFDPEKRLIVTALDARTLQELGATRMR